MIETLLAALAAFLSTNVDDIFILMTLFTLTSKTLTERHILSGQYLGFITLIILSLAGSLLGLIIPKAYIGLLGLLPIYLGLSKFYNHISNKTEPEDHIEIDAAPPSKRFLSDIIGLQTFNIAAITVANGGDNIGIYIPFFANLSITELVYTIIIFLVLVFMLVRAAGYLTQHPALSAMFKKYNHIIFPLVLVGLGVYIFVESRTHYLLQRFFAPLVKTITK